MAASTAVQNFLKSKYDNGMIPREIVKEFPVLDAIPKRADGGGKEFVTAVIIGDPQGIGATLTLAQSGNALGGNLSDIKGKDWHIPYGDYDGSVLINDKQMKQARKDEDAFINLLDEQITGLQRGLLAHNSYLLLADAGNSMGTFTIHASNGTVTLTNASDIVKFPIGMQVQVSANDGSSSSHALLGSGSIGYVFSVNSNAGTFVVATSAANAAAGTGGTPSGWTGTMYGFRAGDFGGTSTPNTIFAPHGAWIPPTDPTSGDSWYTIDRTVAIAPLSGFRLTSAQVAGLSIRARIKKLASIMNNRGTTPGVTHAWLNLEKWQDLANEMEAQGVRILDDQKRWEFGTNSIALAAGGKIIEVIGDRSVPYSWCHLVTMPKDGSNIVMKSVDGFPHVISGDGLEMLRLSGSNDYEHRLVEYPAYAVKAPGWCGRVPV